MQGQIALTDLPNDFSAGDGFNTATFRFNAAAKAPVDTYTGKLDYRLTSNHAAFLRWSEGSNNLYGDYIFDLTVTDAKGNVSTGTVTVRLAVTRVP